MALSLSITFDSRQLRGLSARRQEMALSKTTRRAGATALRDMRSEASKRVRARLRLKVKHVNATLHQRPPKVSGVAGQWALAVSGRPVALSRYPHRQTRKGVSYAAFKGGKRKVIPSSFTATMPKKSADQERGHLGAMMRSRRTRLPIREMWGPKPVDVLRYEGEAEGVAERGRRSFEATFERLLVRELSKAT